VVDEKLAPDTILSSVGQAAFLWDIASGAMQWSDNAASVVTAVPHEALAHADEFTRYIDPQSRAARHDAVIGATRSDTGEGVAYQVQYALKSGTGEAPVWIEETGRWFAGSDGKPGRAQGVVRVVTERHQRETQLAFLSRHDPLTGDLNRTTLLTALEEAIEDANRFRTSFCFLIVAIDDLARFNDAFGVTVADEAIKAIAGRIRLRLRGGDALGRFGGNKFGVLLRNCSLDDMNIAAERLLGSVRNEVVVTSSGAVAITASIGGILVPRHAQSVDQIVNRSQEALDNARKRRGSFVSWRPSPEREAQRLANIRVTDEIVSALNERRAVIVFEPVVGAATRKPAFHESLSRIMSADGQLALAPDVVPIAEKLGLIRLVDHRVLELVVEELTRAPGITLSLNVSPATTVDVEWWHSLEVALRAAPGIAERLIVEITETVAIQDLDQARGFVTRLKNLGARIAIDDFGAGYTSFRNLRRLGVDIVKIDGAFVQNMVHSTDDRVFVQTLLDLAQRLNIETVAEWVQDEETASMLTSWGCNYLQGRLLGFATSQPPWRKDEPSQVAAG
jgi:diguanylate cyclase (GGDEF)-like protein